MAYTPGIAGSQVSNDSDLMRIIADLQRDIRELKAQNSMVPAGLNPIQNGVNLTGSLNVTGGSVNVIGQGLDGFGNPLTTTAVIGTKSITDANSGNQRQVPTIDYATSAGDPAGEVKYDKGSLGVYVTTPDGIASSVSTHSKSAGLGVANQGPTSSPVTDNELTLMEKDTYHNLSGTGLSVTYSEQVGDSSGAVQRRLWAGANAPSSSPAAYDHYGDKTGKWWLKGSTDGVNINSEISTAGDGKIHIIGSAGTDIKGPLTVDGGAIQAGMSTQFLTPDQPTGWSVAGNVYLDTYQGLTRAIMTVKMNRTGGSLSAPTGSYTSVGVIVPAAARSANGVQTYAPAYLTGGSAPAPITAFLNPNTGQFLFQPQTAQTLANAWSITFMHIWTI